MLCHFELRMNIFKVSITDLQPAGLVQNTDNFQLINQKRLLLLLMSLNLTKSLSLCLIKSYLIKYPIMTIFSSFVKFKMEHKIPNLRMHSLIGTLLDLATKFTKHFTEQLLFSQLQSFLSLRQVRQTIERFRLIKESICTVSFFNSRSRILGLWSTSEDNSRCVLIYLILVPTPGIYWIKFCENILRPS